jgi:hypothetical protein
VVAESFFATIKDYISPIELELRAQVAALAVSVAIHGPQRKGSASL